MAVEIEQLDLATLKRKKPIPFVKMDVTVAYNQVGAFTLQMPATARTWDLIHLDGNGELVPVGLVFNWRGIYTVPLLAEDWSFDRTVSVDTGQISETLTLVGSDFLSLLANRIAYPNPAVVWTSQAIGTTTYTGVAETVIKTIVTTNLVTAGDVLRRVPLLSVASNAARGGSVTYKVVTPNPAITTGTQVATVAQSLMDMVRAVDLQSQMGVQITLGASSLVFDCFVPRDLTQKAVFSASLGNLPEATLTATGPNGNTVLTQSKVTAANFTQAIGNGYSDPWRRVEQFGDQSSTDTAADITTSQTQALASGASQVRIALTAVDLPRLRFGADGTGVQGYRVGDMVTLDLSDTVTYSDMVTKVQLVADTTTGTYVETVTPTIGVGSDSIDLTLAAKLSKRLRAVEFALRGSITA